MQFCPSCNASVEGGAVECPSCGIILARWRPRAERPKTAPGSTPRPAEASAPEPAASSRGIPLRTLVMVAAGLVVIGGAWVYFGRIADGKSVSIPRISRIKSLQKPPQYFDQAYQLPSRPQGLATNGTELMVASGSDPWGAIRINRLGGILNARTLPIIEPRYSQKMSLNTITWNGTNYVGYTTAAWFRDGADDWVFTVHDPQTMRPLSNRPAPPLLGCLAWDGKQYWASTRRNTQTSDEEVFLYRIGTDFKVISKSEAPGVGCQGMAWDGSKLWFADVFEDAIYVLDVSGEAPKVEHTAHVSFGYLSGLAWFDGAIWATEYGDNRLLRLDPKTKIAWAGGSEQPTLAGAIGTLSPREGSASPADVVALQQKLRSESMGDRMSAEMELDRLGAPVDYDRYVNAFEEREPADADIIEYHAEMRGDQIYASWKLWFGAEVFTRGEQGQNIVTVPQFARYEVTIRKPDGNEEKQVFEATPGENVRQDVLLTHAAMRGEYKVSIFIHVQYVDSNGTARILNDSGMGLELRK